MEACSFSSLLFIFLSLLLSSWSAAGIRFVIDREECFSHSVPYEGDRVDVSFVVIKAENSWHYGDEGVDFVVCLWHSLRWNRYSNC